MNRQILKQMRMLWLFRTRYRTVDAGRHVYIGAGTHCRSNAVKIGDYVSIGRYCQFEARNISIGDFVMIAGYVGIVDRDAHSVRAVGKPFISTSPPIGLPTIVANDVWIGFGAIILSGVTIGEGSIVAAGSVVVNDVPPYSIVASPKADIVANRFDPQTALLHRERLKQSATTNKRLSVYL